jgi:two-component response regulator (ARR-A family)
MAAAAAAPSVAPLVASPKAGDRKVVPVDAVELKLELEEKHVLAVDDSSVDRAVIAKILRSSKYRGEQSSAIASHHDMEGRLN